MAPTEFCRKRDLIGQFLIFTDNNNAADHVGVPVQVFGGGMDHHVKAGFDRPLNPWRSKGVIRNADDLFSRAIFAMASMSMIFSSGLLGVSIQTMRVLGLIDFRTWTRQ